MQSTAARATPADPAGTERADQLTLGGMPARLYSCTPSRLATFQGCPRRYRFVYVDRPRPARSGAWAHTGVGAALHNALRALWDEPPIRRTPAVAALALRRGWPVEGFRDDGQRRQMLVVATGWLERYVAELERESEPVGVERVVAMRTGVLAFSGRVDRLDQRDDELVVVDYKAGRRALDDDDVRGSPALALYARAAATTLRATCRRVELHHLPSGRVHAWTHSEESLTRVVRRAEGLASDAVAATAAVLQGQHPDTAFPAVPSRACTWCDFHAHCPAGQQVGARRVPWAGLPEEVLG